MITGDVVTVQRFPGGRTTATTQPGKDRENVRFHTTEVDGNFSVIPSDMVPYLAKDLIDKRLFAVGDLIEQGYDDARAPELPLILSYGEGVKAANTGEGVPLTSVNARAIRPKKNALPVLWDTAPGVRSAAEPRLRDGLAKVWLDGKVRASLEHSVPQVGAPEAWKSGFDGKGVKVAVLDTGIDRNHPDLRGKVTEARNFTKDPSAADGHGHGTHVAATIAGQGVGAIARKGVAPGAELVVGKVLDHSGSGSDSEVLAGMEWAAREAKADVVSMSLGGAVTDGTDPLSVAVDTLSAETGALFVIAAGNEGKEYMVGSPGAATSALTVGAVDRNDALAAFSSRGPRLDNAPKPDITAPGVDIVAARAEGTTMGTPIDELYTRASGTSMATPHVAGAAAILAQRHPDWTGGQLKNGLMSTTKTIDGQTAHEQGSGRLDVARAAAQSVTATGVVNLGVRQSDETAPAEETVTYTNTGQSPVTLKLTATLENLDGGAPPPGAVRIGTPEVTVAAGTSADVKISVDVTGLKPGRHTGRLTATATGGAETVHTSLALERKAPKHQVRFQGLDNNGSPTVLTGIFLFGTSVQDDEILIAEEEGVEVELPEGTYSAFANARATEEESPLVTFMTVPEFEVRGDMEMVLDARKAVPIDIRTPEPVEIAGMTAIHAYREYGRRKIIYGYAIFPSEERLAATPTEPVTHGTFEFASRWQLSPRRVTAEIAGSRAPLIVRPSGGSPEFAGRKRWPLVFAGAGTARELSRINARGKAVVITSHESIGDYVDKLPGIAKAGAAALIVVGPDGIPVWQKWTPVYEREPLPTLLVTHDQGQRLIERAREHAVLDVSADFSPDRLYDIMQVSPGRIPARVVHTVNGRNTATVEASYHESGGAGWATEQRFGWRPWQKFLLAAQPEQQRTGKTAHRRIEYVSSGDTQWLHVVQHAHTPDPMAPLRGGITSPPRAYRAGERVTEKWFGPVVRPAVPANMPDFAPTRTGDMLSIDIPEFVDAEGNFGNAGGSPDPDTAEARFFRDGRLVEERAGIWGQFPAMPQKAEYRLELSTTRTSEEWQHATSTRTAWTFRSARAEGTKRLPLLGVDYDVPADLNGEVPRGLPVPLGFAAPGANRLTAELSYDDGRTWKRLPVFPVGHGRHLALAGHRATDKGVSLRVTASGPDGAKFEQTIIRAYGVR
ncbi:S8 family peptidase [Spongiactinospora rosea]|uniref:S8 family peptidase n=1 Tax=Spongiactinospora rosea TaxID=2248750 RepID=UPI001313DED5|nr:S8 family serine peptidase [Spongiactinospora rosea]